MPMHHQLLAAPVAMLFLSACGGAADPATPAVRDSAGVQIVTSPATDRSLPWRFTEVGRLGGAERGPAAFTAASPALVRTDGANRIVVLDRDRSLIAVFDGSGTPVMELGGAGGGPGEFSFAIELFDAGADEIAVFDFAKRAIVRWSARGELLAERRGDDWPGGWYGMALRGDTTIIGLNADDSLRSLRRLVRMTPRDTVTLDSVLAPPAGMVDLGCVALRMSPMFSPRLTWRAHGASLAVVRQDEYRVDVYRGARLERSLRRPFAPEPTDPDAARRMHPDGWTVSFQGGGRCSVEGPEVAAKAGMADHLPVLADAAFGPDGTVWVARHAFPGDSSVTDVFDAGGAYLGTVHGRGLPLGWLAGDRILFPIEDELTGVTVIGIYRIERLPGDGMDET